MEKQYAPSAKEKKVTAKATAPQTAAPITESKEEVKVETKTEEKKETKKIEEKKTVKENAVVNAYQLTISSKHSYAICDMIRGKSIDASIEMLEMVVIGKKAVPMNNREVPHRKGPMMAGRFPKNASKEFILLLKQLKANCNVNGIENPIINFAVANRGSRRYKRGGTRSKSTHVYLEAISKVNKIAKNKLNKNKK